MDKKQMGLIGIVANSKHAVIAVGNKQSLIVIAANSYKVMNHFFRNFRLPLEAYVRKYEAWWISSGNAS